MVLPLNDWVLPWLHLAASRAFNHKHENWQGCFPDEHISSTKARLRSSTREGVFGLVRDGIVSRATTPRRARRFPNRDLRPLQSETRRA
jgi:hypothetical protein